MWASGSLFKRDANKSISCMAPFNKTTPQLQLSLSLEYVPFYFLLLAKSWRNRILRCTMRPVQHAPREEALVGVRTDIQILYSLSDYPNATFPPFNACSSKPKWNPSRKKIFIRLPFLLSRPLACESVSMQGGCTVRINLDSSHELRCRFFWSFALLKSSIELALCSRHFSSASLRICFAWLSEHIHRSIVRLSIQWLKTRIDPRGF